jgi:cation:H+ antiporter
VRLEAPDLAIGDLFGSSKANMLILALIDVLFRRQKVLRRAALDHALSACLAISLNALAAVLVLLRPGWTVLGLSPGSLLLFLVYLAGTRAVTRHARRDAPPPAPAGARPGVPGLQRALLGFAGASLAILLSAPVFAWSAKGIAEVTGLGQTFVGTWPVGLSTSLPELVASLAAVRLGAFDLAVANLFGSNAFNMAIFLVLDLAQPGSLFAGVDPSHALSAVFGVILMTLGLAAIVYRAEQRFAMIEPDSILVLVAYAVGLGLLYAYSVPG